MKKIFVIFVYILTSCQIGFFSKHVFLLSFYQKAIAFLGEKMLMYHLQISLKTHLRQLHFPHCQQGVEGCGSGSSMQA